MRAPRIVVRAALVCGLAGAAWCAWSTVDDHAAHAAPKPPPVEQPGGVLDRAAQLPDKASARAKAVVATVTADRPAPAAKPAKPAKPKAPRVKPTKPATPHGHTPPVDLPTDGKPPPRPTKPPPPVDLPPPPSPDPVDDVVDQLPLPEPPLDPADTPTDPAPPAIQVPAPPILSPAPPAPAVIPGALPVVIGPIAAAPAEHIPARDRSHRHAAATDALDLIDWCWEPYDRPGALPTATHPAAGGSHAHADRQCAPHPPAPQPAGTTASGSSPGTACAPGEDTIGLTPPASAGSVTPAPAPPSPTGPPPCSTRAPPDGRPTPANPRAAAPASPPPGAPGKEGGLPPGLRSHHHQHNLIGATPCTTRSARAPSPAPPPAEPSPSAW